MGACATKLKGAVKADAGDAPIPMKEEVLVTLSKEVSVPEPTKEEVVVAPPTKNEVVAAPEKDEVVVSEKSLEIDGSGEQDIEKRRSLSLLFKEDLLSVPNKDAKDSTEDETLPEKPAKPEEILVTEKTIEQCETKTPEIEVEKSSETLVVSEIKKSEIVEEAPKTVQVTEVTPVPEAKPEEPIETEQCETKTPEIKVEQKPETVVEPEIEKHEIVTEQVHIAYVEAPKEPVVAKTPPVTLPEVKPEEPSKIEKITEQCEIETPEIKERTLQEIEIFPEINDRALQEVEFFDTVTEPDRDTYVEAPKAEEVAVPQTKPEEPLKTEKMVTEQSESKTPEIEVQKKAETPVKSEIEKSPAPKTEELAIAPPAPEVKKPEISEEKEIPAV